MIRTRCGNRLAVEQAQSWSNCQPVGAGASCGPVRYTLKWWMVLPSAALGTVLSREPSQLRALTSLHGGRTVKAGDPTRGGEGLSGVKWLLEDGGDGGCRCRTAGSQRRWCGEPDSSPRARDERAFEGGESLGCGAVVSLRIGPSCDSDPSCSPTEDAGARGYRWWHSHSIGKMAQTKKTDCP